MHDGGDGGRRGAPGERWVTPGAVALAAAAVAIVGVSISGHGVGVNSDGVSYLAGARSLAAFEGYEDVPGTHIVSWPPGYSAYLALFRPLAGTLTAAAVAQLVAVAALVVLTVALARQLLRPVPALAVGVVLVLMTRGPIDVGGLVLSETLFSALLVAALLVAVRRGPDPARWSAGGDVGYGVLLGLLPLVRYLGGAVTLGLLGLAAWQVVRTRGPRAALVRTALPALALPGAWLVVNRAVTGSAVGARGQKAGLGTNIRAAADTVGRWVVPLDVSTSVWLAAAVGLGGAVAIALVVARGAGAEPGPSAWSTPASALPVGVAAIGVVVGVVLGATGGSLYPVDVRVLAPLVVPLLLLGARLLDRVRSTAPLLGRIAVVGLVVLVGLQALVTADNARERRATGLPYFTQPEFEDLGAVAHTRERPPEVVVFSNQSQGLAVVTDRRVLGSPSEAELRRADPGDDRLTIVEAACEGGPVELVWLPDWSNDAYLTPDQLGAWVGLDALASGPGWQAYRVSCRR